MKEEIWRDICFIENYIEYDFTGLYQISNFGRVKSLNYHQTGKKKILKAQKTKDGYLFVRLCKDGKVKTFRVNRLVAFMFIKNDDKINKVDVNHINEDKTNNCIENLEWCTRKYNMNYGTRKENLSKKIIGFSSTETKVIVLKSIRQSKLLGFSFGNISLACRGKYCENHIYKGYKWYYFDDIKNNKLVSEED